MDTGQGVVLGIVGLDRRITYRKEITLLYMLRRVSELERDYLGDMVVEVMTLFKYMWDWIRLIHNSHSC